MSIPLTQQSVGGILPDYAAASSSTSRTVQKVNGVMVPRFTGSIFYQRTDYVLDSEGNKIGIVQADTSTPMVPGGDLRTGNVHVSAEQFEAAMVADPELAAAFEKIAAFEDSLIHADLVRRGIIQE